MKFTSYKSYLHSYFQSHAKLENEVFSVTSSNCGLKGMYLSALKLTEEQPGIALLMHKSSPPLLSHFSLYPEYVTIPEIQNLVASHKIFS